MVLYSMKLDRWVVVKRLTGKLAVFVEHDMAMKFDDLDLDNYLKDVRRISRDLREERENFNIQSGGKDELFSRSVR